MRSVTIPTCIAEADRMLKERGRTPSTSPRGRACHGTSPGPASCRSPSLRATSPLSPGAQSLSSTAAWPALQTPSKAGGDATASRQAGAFRAWLRTVDSTSVSCFEVFRQCLDLAPGLCSHVFASVCGSQSEVPANAIGNVFERLVGHPPHKTQEDQLMMFLDLQVRPAGSSNMRQCATRLVRGQLVLLCTQIVRPAG